MSRAKSLKESQNKAYLVLTTGEEIGMMGWHCQPTYSWDVTSEQQSQLTWCEVPNLDDELQTTCYLVWQQCCTPNPSVQKWCAWASMVHDMPAWQSKLFCVMWVLARAWMHWWMLILAALVWCWWKLSSGLSLKSAQLWWLRKCLWDVLAQHDLLGNEGRRELFAVLVFIVHFHS